MAHPWIAARPEVSAEVAVEGKEDGDASVPGIVHDGADEHVKERRQELLKRLEVEHNARAREADGQLRRPEQLQHHEVKEFFVDDRGIRGAKLRFEWWSRERATRSGVLGVQGKAARVAAEAAGEASDLRMFSRMLEEHHIDPSLFGKSEAKTLEQLAGEVRSGAARLMLDATEHKKLVRVVDVVVLRFLADAGDGRPPLLLIETRECYADGRCRDTFRLPGTKKEPHENTRQTTWRIIREMLALSGEGVKCNLTKIDRHEEEGESPSYPGVRTVYRKEIVEAMLISSDPDQLARSGVRDLRPWSSSDASGNTRYFSWLTNEEAEAKKVKLKAEEAESISTLVRAPIGLSEEALHTHLTSLGIDVSRFGQGNAKSLKEFSSELIKGEATLMHDSAGTLKRVVDVVVMIITNPKTGETLIQTEQIHPDGHVVTLNRLPGAKRRPDENQFLSARRILRKQLEIDENHIRLNREVEFVEDEKPSPSYPGLTTLYRKRLIRAELIA